MSARDLAGEHEIEQCERGALHDYGDPRTDETQTPCHSPSEYEQRDADHHVTGVQSDVQPQEAIEASGAREIAKLDALEARQSEDKDEGAPSRGLDPEMVEQGRAMTAHPQQPEQRASDEEANASPDDQSYQMGPLGGKQGICPHELHGRTLARVRRAAESDGPLRSVQGCMRVQLADTEAFERLATVADMVRSTTKRLQKLAALMAYLPTLSDESLAIAARFLSGIVFPRHDARTTQVGGSILWTALASVSGMPDESLAEAYTRHGDAGDMVGDVLAGQPASGHTLAWIEERFSALARASGSTARREIVRETLAVLGGNEARYFAKLLGGELRIGLKEAQVEEALARAFEQPIDQVRHANRLRGDIGEVAILARHGTLASARLALFHPIGFMLAQPLATPEAIVAVMPSPFVIEDKYDGIRAQAHVDGDEVRLFSRTLDDITHGYPDVVSSLRGLGTAWCSTASSLRWNPRTAAGRARLPCFSAAWDERRPVRPCSRTLR